MAGERESFLGDLLWSPGFVRVSVISRVVPAAPHCITEVAKNADGTPKIGPCNHDWNQSDSIEIVGDKLAALLSPADAAALGAVRNKIWAFLQAEIPRFGAATLKDKIQG